MTQLKIMSSRQVLFFFSSDKRGDYLHMVYNEFNKRRKDTFLVELKEVYHFIGYNHIKLHIFISLLDLGVVIIFVQHYVINWDVFIYYIKGNSFVLMRENYCSTKYCFFNELNSKLLFEHSVWFFRNLNHSFVYSTCQLM